MKYLKAILALSLFFIGFTSSNAQEITVFPGFWGYEFYQGDKEITKQELEELFEKDEELKRFWKRYKTSTGLAFAAIGAEIGLGIWALNTYDKDKRKFETAPVVATFSFAVIGTIFLLKANSNLKAAILTYNRKLDGDKAELTFGLGNYGAGFTFSF